MEGRDVSPVLKIVCVLSVSVWWLTTVLYPVRPVDQGVQDEDPCCHRGAVAVKGRHQEVQ